MNNYLIHWQLPKAQDKHKYIARVQEGKYTRYFYTTAEYQAYIRGEKKANKTATKSEDKKLKQSPKHDGITKSTQKATNKSLLDKISDNAKKTEKKIVGIIKSQTTKTVNESIAKLTSLKFGNSQLNKKANAGKEQIGMYRKANIVNSITSFVNKISNKDTDLSDLKKKTKDCTKQEDQEAVNPKYTPKTLKDPNPDDGAWTRNCSYCTATWDLRQRGYDVEAQPHTDETRNSMDEVKSWYKDSEIVSDTEKIAKYRKNGASLSETYDYYETILKEGGDGSYGHLMYRRTDGSAHNVVYSVEDGSVVIRDCQSNNTYTIAEWFSEDGHNADKIFHMRTDNLEVTDKIKKACRSRK